MSITAKSWKARDEFRLSTFHQCRDFALRFRVPVARASCSFKGLRTKQLPLFITILFLPRVSFEMSKWRNSEPSELCLHLPLRLEGYGLFR